MNLVIDSGGTSFKYLVSNDKFEILDEDSFASGNLATNFDDFIENITTIFKKYKSFRKSIIGIAGWNSINKNKKNIVENIVKKYILNYKIVSDGSLIAYSIKSENAFLITLGTGSSIFIKNKNKIDQKLGFGYLIGDIGSGYEIGKNIIFNALVEEREDIIEGIKDFFNIKNGSLISYIYENSSNINSKIASLVKGINSNNIKFKNFCETIAFETLNKFFEYFSKINNENFDIYLNGGIFSNSNSVTEAFKRRFINQKIYLIKKNSLHQGLKSIREELW